MGLSLAEAYYLQGADVTLIAGPLQVSTSFQGIKVVDVRSAAEMEAACLAHFASADLLIMAAAVADYRPAVQAVEKIKKSEATTSIVLEKTTDILAALGAVKKPHQLLVGFALETENEEANALAKMKTKKTDFIVLNSLKDAGAGFGVDTNQVTVFAASGEKKLIPLQSKDAVASEIIDFVSRGML
jgi:phosphopantothenoylcysteine decarboxylase/phosphopantothenate--cysteine ligase